MSVGLWCGVFIFMDKFLHYNLYWNTGMSTNSLAEVKAFADLFAFCMFFDINFISIFGDSKTMVDHVNSNSLIKCLHLTYWLDRIMFFWGQMGGSSIQHGYRDRNQVADGLSKEGLQLGTGSWSLEVFARGSPFPSRTSAFRVFNSLYFCLYDLSLAPPF